MYTALAVRTDRPCRSEGPLQIVGKIESRGPGIEAAAREDRFVT
jgi:hypothetical protein